MKIVGPIPDSILKLMDKKDRPKGVAGMTSNEIEQANEKKTEKELQEQIRAYLSQKDCVFYNARMDKKSTVAVGICDFGLAWCGVPIAFEVKTQTGKLSEEQKAMHIKMGRNGWKVYVVRSLQEVKVILDSIVS